MFGKSKKDLTQQDIEKILFDREQYNEELERFSKPILAESLEEGAKKGADILGIELSYDATNEEAMNWIHTESGTKIRGINDTTLDKLRLELLTGMDAGEGIDGLRQRVSDTFEDAKGWRAENIARTETIRAYRHGNLEQYKESGFVEEVMGWAALDERTCEECLEEIHNKRFTIAEAEEVSQSIHPSCRCDFIPIVEEVKPEDIEGLTEEEVVEREDLDQWEKEVRDMLDKEDLSQDDIEKIGDIIYKEVEKDPGVQEAVNSFIEQDILKIQADDYYAKAKQRYIQSGLKIPDDVLINYDQMHNVYEAKRQIWEKKKGVLRDTVYSKLKKIRDFGIPDDLPLDSFLNINPVEPTKLPNALDWVNAGTTKLTKKEQVSVARVFKEMSDYYPSDWFRASANLDTMKIYRLSRGGYVHTHKGQRVSVMAVNPSRHPNSTIVHEMHHRFDSVINVKKKNLGSYGSGFRESRRLGEPNKWLGSPYDPTEKGINGKKFVEVYMGKFYAKDLNASEIGSTGVQMLWEGDSFLKSGYYIFSRDPQYFKHVIGLLTVGG